MERTRNARRRSTKCACRTKPRKRSGSPTLQYIKSTDTQEQGQDPESECTVRIVAATYSEDESEGAMCVLNLLTRIRVALLKDGVVGGQFVLKSPLEMIVYPDSTAPYYLGEMMTKWTMPIIESEVQQIWQ